VSFKSGSVIGLVKITSKKINLWNWSTHNKFILEIEKPLDKWLFSDPEKKLLHAIFICRKIHSHLV
jgi:hypothetical protein